jgi:hypothetical protein
MASVAVVIILLSVRVFESMTLTFVHAIQLDLKWFGFSSSLYSVFKSRVMQSDFYFLLITSN